MKRESILGMVIPQNTHTMLINSEWITKEEGDISKDYLRRRSPGLGYKVLSLFADKGIFKMILTTNFDGLATKALQEEGVSVREITIETADLIHKPIPKRDTYCVALHGDYKYSALKNTSEELDSQSKDFEFSLSRHLYNKHFIVAGYSGRDCSLMTAIENAYKDKGGGVLFWCSYDDEVSPVVENLLKKVSLFGRDAYLVVMGDFDDSMKATGLYCFNDDKEYVNRLKGIAQFSGIEGDKVISNQIVIDDNKITISTDDLVTEDEIDLSTYSKDDLNALASG